MNKTMNTAFSVLACVACGCTDTVKCGRGRYEPVHNQEVVSSRPAGVEAHTNTEGEASIDAGDLGGIATSERLVVSAPAIGLVTEMVVDPAGPRREQEP